MEPDTTTNSWNFDNFLVWLYENRKAAGLGAAVLALVLIGAAFYSWKKNNDESRANAALFALPSLLGPSGRTTPVHSEDFQKIAGSYPNTQAGERAELIAAGILFTEEKYAEAQRQFSKFLAAHEGSPLQSQAALGFAASLEAQGKIPEAIAKYQEVITKYPADNIISPAKLTLARLFEAQNKPADALKLYEELGRTQNPYDPWASEAGERRELLLEKNPQLKKKPVPAMTTAPATNLLFSPKPSLVFTNKNSIKK